VRLDHLLSKTSALAVPTIYRLYLLKAEDQFAMYAAGVQGVRVCSSAG
jgi:hypothetical protein